MHLLKNEIDHFGPVIGLKVWSVPFHSWDWILSGLERALLWLKVSPGKGMALRPMINLLRPEVGLSNEIWTLKSLSGQLQV